MGDESQGLFELFNVMIVSISLWRKGDRLIWWYRTYVNVEGVGKGWLFCIACLFALHLEIYARRVNSRWWLGFMVKLYLCCWYRYTETVWVHYSLLVHDLVFMLLFLVQASLYIYIYIYIFLWRIKINKKYFEPCGRDSRG